MSVNAPIHSPPLSLGRRVMLGLLSLGMVAIGVEHFLHPEPFVKIVPPFLPKPLLLVQVSGFFEILGGLGVVIPATRRAAAWGLIALFVAVFPANVYMAIAHVQPEPWLVIPTWAMWARLPLQAVFIGAAYSFARRPAR